MCFICSREAAGIEGERTRLDEAKLTLRNPETDARTPHFVFLVSGYFVRRSYIFSQLNLTSGVQMKNQMAQCYRERECSVTSTESTSFFPLAPALSQPLRFIEKGYLCQGTGRGLNKSKDQLPPQLPHHLLPAVEGQQQSVTIPRDCRGPAMGTSPCGSGSSPLQTFRAAEGWWFLIQRGPLPFD